MDAPELLDLLDRFFARRLDRAGAVRALGTEQEATPERVVLTPGDPDVRRGRLELFDGQLVGMIIGLRDALLIPLSDIEPRFGRGTEGARMKPDEEIPFDYAFEREGEPRMLSIKGAGVSRANGGDQMSVRVVIARRPPAIGD